MEALRENPKVTVVTRYTLSIPELYPMVGLRNDQGNPISSNSENQSSDHTKRLAISYKQDSERTSIQKENKYGCESTVVDCEYSDNNPKSVLKKARILFEANYYEAADKVLDVLDLHLVLPPDYQMAKEYGHGVANQKLGKHKKAKGYFNSFLELTSSLNSDSNYSLASQCLGEIEISSGNFVAAEKHYINAVKHFSLNTVAAIFDVELSESLLYLKFGQCQIALKKYKDSISSMCKAIKLAKNKQELLEANMNNGHAYMHLQEYKQSLHSYKESLKLVVELGDRKSEGLLHGNIGNVLLNLNEKPCALQHLITAYHFSAKYECNSTAVGKAVSNLANGYAGIDDIQKALEYYEIAQNHFIYARDLQSEGRACGNIGNMHMILKDYKKAIECYDEVLSSVKDAASKEAANHNRCLAKFEIAIAQEDYVNALVLAEETRAPSVSRLICKKKASDQSNLYTASNPMTLEDIYKMVTSHKIPVVFTSYCITKLVMWILVPIKDDVKMECCLIQLKDFCDSSFEQYIQCKLLETGFNLFDPPSCEQKETFTKLYDSVGKKIEEIFKNLGANDVTEFIFIPDNTTYLLPFSAMLDEQYSETFGDRFRIRIYPSFLSLQMMNMIHTDDVVQISNNEHDCLVVGNPKIPPFIHNDIQWNLGRLPYAELEASLVSNILHVTPLVSEQATKQGVLYRIRNANIIHIATHGSGSAGFLAFSSSFPLSKEGCAKPEEILIYPSDIEALNISPALVVLSSCQSNRGTSNSDAVMGMAGAFLCAGAQSVLVSSFSVADESTCIFMELFYRFLMDGFSSSQALQKSTQCMRCISKFSGFSHWAGFQIIGKDISINQKTEHDSTLDVMLLGKMSIIPREYVEEMRHALQSNGASKVQLLMGITGSEPIECAKDYVKKYYHLYLRGVYWLNGADELMLETSVKLTDMMCEKESSDKSQKKLVIFDNISRRIKIDHLIDSKTDIIIICNSKINKDDFKNDIEEMCSRSVNVITVKNLTTIDTLKRVTYNLLKSSSFSPKDSHLQLFSKLGELTMGTVTLTNIVAKLLTKHNTDKVSTIVDHCIELVTIEKELCKSSPNMLLTCNSLIKSIVSPETQLLLSSLSVLGIHGIIIPDFIITEVENLIIQPDSLASKSCCFKELKDFSIIHKYPYPCVFRNTETTLLEATNNHYIDFYCIPELICNAVWEQKEEGEHLLNTLILLKAIELKISQEASDILKLELMFEILTILYNHLVEDQLLSKCIHLRVKIAYILHYCNVVL